MVASKDSRGQQRGTAEAMCFGCPTCELSASEHGHDAQPAHLFKLAPAHALPSTSGVPLQPTLLPVFTRKGTSHACLSLELAGGRRSCSQLVVGALVEGESGHQARGRTGGAVSAGSRGCTALRLGTRPHALRARSHARCFMVPCAQG